MNVAYKQIRLAAPLKRPIRYVLGILSFCRLGLRLVRFQSVPPSVFVCAKFACERETLISFCQEKRLLELERKARIFLTLRRGNFSETEMKFRMLRRNAYVFLVCVFMSDRFKYEDGHLEDPGVRGITESSLLNTVEPLITDTLINEHLQ
jgi:hypothetical protein